MCLCVYIHVCVYMYMFVWIFIYTYVYTLAHAHAHIYVHSQFMVDMAGNDGYVCMNTQRMRMLIRMYEYTMMDMYV